MNHKLYIHDDGSTTCIKHAPHSLLGSLESNPNKRIHWTPRGTWELATADYYDEFREGTGFDLECEICMQREEN
jgi:hypothetical protein